jgi:hypothetical protein
VTRKTDPVPAPAAPGPAATHRDPPDAGSPGLTAPGWAAPGAAAGALLCSARACYGGLLLCAPRRVLSLAARHPASPGAAAVARILGVRHLLQTTATAGVLAGTPPSPRVVPGRARQAVAAVRDVLPPAARQPGTVLLAGSAADALHAASMAGLAAVCSRYRRAVLADVLLEAGFAAFGIMTGRRG